MGGLTAAIRVRRERVSDVRRALDEAGITSSFFLCATPRTGSWLLADVISGSGVAGAALEHFSEHALPHGRRVLLADFLVDLAGKAHGTGCFGTKLIWYQRDRMLERLRRLRGAAGLSDGSLVAAVFPEPRYLFLTREDVAAQAVSWWRAKATGVWRDWDTPKATAAFDFPAIDERARLVDEQNADWGRWFEANEIEPLALTYEELVADPAAVATKALHHLGLEPPAGYVPAPAMRRQADGLSEEWIRRYRELSERP